MSPNLKAAHDSPLCRPGGRTARPHLGGILALAAIAFSLASPTVLAESSIATGTEARRASASLDFRIVIPETVRFDRGEEQRDRTRQFTSRTVEEDSGRQIVTVARP